jgi:hypothetical protein
LRHAGVNKYGATKAACAYGHQHASKREAKRCNDLHILERAGQITHLEVEPQFWFVINGEQMKHDNGRRVGYKADFSYREGDKAIAEDSKGFVVRDWPLRRALFRHLFPLIELREV